MGYEVGTPLEEALGGMQTVSLASTGEPFTDRVLGAMGCEVQLGCAAQKGPASGISELVLANKAPSGPGLG